MEEKGLDDLLDAMAPMRSKPSLALLGQGQIGAALLDRARILGLASRVGVHRWGNPGDVACFVNAIDLSVLLIRTSGCVGKQFGRAIIESQTCGTPLVGSTCGAIPDVVGDGGWVVPERSPGVLADCLDVLCDHPELLQDAGRAGLLQVEQRFTYERIASILTRSWKCARAERRLNAGSLDRIGTTPVPTGGRVRGRNLRAPAVEQVGQHDRQDNNAFDWPQADGASLPWLSVSPLQEDAM